MVEMCTDEGDIAEFGLSLQLVGDAGGSGVGLTLQRVLAPLGLEVLGEGDFPSVSSLCARYLAHAPPVLLSILPSPALSPRRLTSVTVSPEFPFLLVAVGFGQRRTLI